MLKIHENLTWWETLKSESNYENLGSKYNKILFPLNRSYWKSSVETGKVSLIPPRWGKQVICSLFLQRPLNEHILNGPSWKQTNFSGFSLSQKQKAFPPGDWWNSEINKVHNIHSHGKNNWGKWTNHPASSRWQTLQLFRSNKPQYHQLYRCRHIYVYTHDYLEAKYGVCKHPPPCIYNTAKHDQKAGRFLLCTVKQGRSLCLVT